MSTPVAAKSSPIHPNPTDFPNKSIRRTVKWLLISAIIVYLIYIVSSNHTCCKPSKLSAKPSREWDCSDEDRSSTNISHIVFGISGSTTTWKSKKQYIEAWWRPNVTRGYLFLEKPPSEYLPWPLTVDPQFRVSEDTGRYKADDKHVMPYVIRMVRVIAEAFRAETKGVRWYVLADDDTVFMVNNLVDVLAKYDHRKYYYVGGNAESVVSDFYGSFDMAFGGGGFALSYPLAEALVENMDICIRAYPTMYGSDHILHACIADLGVSLTHEKGFHQIDLRGDISGLLSAHPLSPFVSLHHLDAVNPIFPFMDRHESLNHLMKAAEQDEPRMLQQTVCYDHHHNNQRNWTFSVSWGYSSQIYEAIIFPSTLQSAIESFAPWKKGAFPSYVFNTRARSTDPCQAPHVFFFDSVEETLKGHVVTRYARRFPRRLPTCGDHSADHISKIHVVSPIGKTGSRRECCDVLRTSDANTTVIKLRACLKDEMVV